MLNERLRKRLAADQASFIERCLPSPASKPPAGSNWIPRRPKHDGYRLIARRDPVGNSPHQSAGQRLVGALCFDLCINGHGAFLTANDGNGGLLLRFAISNLDISAPAAQINGQIEPQRGRLRG